MPQDRDFKKLSDLNVFLVAEKCFHQLVQIVIDVSKKFHNFFDSILQSSNDKAKNFFLMPTQALLPSL